MRTLFVSNSLPCPTISGGAQRTELILRALSRRGEVDVLYVPTYTPPPEALPETRERFRVIGTLEPRPAGGFAPWRWIRRADPARVDRIADIVSSHPPGFRPQPRLAERAAAIARDGRYDLIFGRYTLPAVLTGVGRLGPSLLDIDDVDTQLSVNRAEDAAAGLRRLVRRRYARLMAERAPREWAAFTRVFVSSPSDLPLVDHPGRTVLPNIPWHPPGRPIAPLPPLSGEGGCVGVVASWHYPPNVAGLDRFLERSWPRVRAAHPGARLSVFGAGVRDAQARSWAGAPGVTVVGKVGDLGEAYGRSLFTIAPVYAGGGTKVKVLESLAYGRTCVPAEHAHRGYEEELRDGEAVLVGRTDEQIADACVHLLKDPALRDRLAARGAETVKRRFSFERVCATVDEAIDAALRDPASAGAAGSSGVRA